MYAAPLPDNSQRAKTAASLMLVTICIFAISTLISVFKFFAIDMVDSYYAIIMVEGALGLVQLVIQILTIIFFIMWFRRAYNNLWIVGARDLPYSEGWAAGGWFVPIISLFYPYRIMNAIWDNTQTALRKTGEQYEIKRDGNIGWWWTFYLTGSIISNLQVQLTFRGMMYEFDSTILGMDLISNAALTVAAFICWRIIKRTSEMEDDLKRRYNEYLAWQTQQQGQQYQQQQSFPQQP